MNLGSANARTLAAGASLAALAMLSTHPVVLAACLLLAVVLARRLGLSATTPRLRLVAAVLGLAVFLFNAAFSWRGATTLWEAPLRLAWLGRPRLTVQALAWGATAGVQLAVTVVALTAATVAVPPEALNRAMERAGLPASLARAGALALRLVPDTRQDARAMGDALRTRGVDTRSIEGASRALVPLAARSLDRAAVAEEALLVRGYDPQARETGWPPAGLLALAGVLLAAIVAFAGPGRPSFYPRASIPLDAVTLGLLGLALAIPAFLVWRAPRCSS